MLPEASDIHALKGAAMPGIRDFRDKVAVITGAGSGIGRATAVAFADAGAAVVVVDIQRDRIDAVVEAIASKGGKVSGRQVDVADESQVKALAEYVIGEHGGIDILYNNAGVGIGGRAFDSSPADWEWIIGINLWGVIYGMRHFLPHMIEKRSGHVINTASLAGLVMAPGLAAYSATKHAVVGLSQAMRLEMKEHNIGVSVICPGIISTNIAADSRFTSNEEDGVSLEDAAKLLEEKGWPPERVAEAVLKAVRRNKSIVPVGPEAWLAWYLMRTSPRLCEVFMNYLIRKASKT